MGEEAANRKVVRFPTGFEKIIAHSPRCFDFALPEAIAARLRLTEETFHCPACGARIILTKPKGG